MRLLNRLADILSANLNELVKRYEDPELLLKQAVQEMDESIRVALGQAVKVVAHEKILARQLADEEAAINQWRGRAEEAIRRGNDELAREALLRKRDHETATLSLAKQLEEANRTSQTLREQIETMRHRASGANRKLGLLAARQRAAEARLRLLRELSASPLGEPAFDKFERMCRKVERTEAEAEALAELSSPSQNMSAAFDFENNSTNLTIETELEELQAQCGA